jgi:hypothetical protein
MDVDLTIRYSDDRLCEIVVCRPSDDTPLYRVVTTRRPRRKPHGSDTGSTPALRGHPLARSASPLRRLKFLRRISGRGRQMKSLSQESRIVEVMKIAVGVTVC